ncbi:hypothetical protein [Maricaulis sp.]|uniref:hypothetical protein n=1 Tax=Maricaulis sp. TaxID=1486257 RepID=UPI0025C6D46F|nr:hypothetical protein [Maricaulis sp.]
MARTGTLDWMEKTHGKLGLVDRLRLIGQGVRARAATRSRLRDNVRLRHVEVDDILPPDSAIAREAMAVCEDASEPWLFNHCMRAWFWARLLDDGREPVDHEVLFTGLMLHDLGLTERHSLAGRAERCFTLPGARMAEALAAKHDWSGSRARLMAQAITLHLNIEIEARHGREAELLRAGAGGDVAGLGLDVVHADQIGAVCDRYPRLQLKTSITPVLQAEARARPGCRIHFLIKTFRFDRLIANAPMFTE